MKISDSQNEDVDESDFHICLLGKDFGVMNASNPVVRKMLVIQHSWDVISYCKTLKMRGFEHQLYHFCYLIQIFDYELVMDSLQ